MADIHPVFTGADGSGVESETALGPQYRLSSNVVLGGSIEKPDLFADNANAGAERYTFGLRITF